MEVINLVKIFLPTTVAFFLGIFFTPIATHFFFKYKMWKKYPRNGSITAQDFTKIHDQARELNTPRIGGVIIWISVLLTTFIFFLLPTFFPGPLAEKLNFLSRNQTLIPFFTLLLGSILGLWEDLVQIYGTGNLAKDDATWRKWKAFLIFIIALLVGAWFFYKLGMTTLHLPFNGEITLGILIIPFFVLVALATFSGSVIDGVDGLSGGVMAAIFGAYSAIAFANNQIDLAAFSGVVTGATLAFLWYNIPPARFFMGETGMMGLTVTLATLAFLTNSVLILPVVALPLVLTSGSVILQTFWKKFFGRRLFRLTPIHHHFEALGWPSHKVTMRFWVLSVVFAILGIILFVLS
jgi:phospho-N-acetylmuramoyl-pentapeptide-transferase